MSVWVPMTQSLSGSLRHVAKDLCREWPREPCRSMACPHRSVGSLQCGSFEESGAEGKHGGHAVVVLPLAMTMRGTGAVCHPLSPEETERVGPRFPLPELSTWQAGRDKGQHLRQGCWCRLLEGPRCTVAQWRASPFGPPWHLEPHKAAGQQRAVPTSPEPEL